MVCEYVSDHYTSGPSFALTIPRISVAGLTSWFGIAVTYIRFHHGLRVQGVDRQTLPYRSPFQPFAAWYAAIGCFVIVLVRCLIGASSVTHCSLLCCYIVQRMARIPQGSLADRYLRHNLLAPDALPRPLRWCQVLDPHPVDTLCRYGF